MVGRGEVAGARGGRVGASEEDAASVRRPQTRWSRECALEGLDEGGGGCVGLGVGGERHAE